MKRLLSPTAPFKVRALLRSVGALFFFATAAAAQEPELSAPDQKDYVTEVFPYRIDTVFDRAALLFDSEARDFYDDYNARIYDLPEQVANYKDLSPEAYEQFLAFPMVRTTKFYVFFAAYETMQQKLQDFTPLSVMGHSNVALQRYATLSRQERAWDLYLWSPDVPYWRSEYTMQGAPLPFRSYFILHLTSVDESHTSVEVIEDEPVVRMGKRLSVDEHGIVHRYEVREVEPTTGDREFVLSCLHQFIERDVPGRHWFNCRDKNAPPEPAPVPFTVP